MNFESLKSLFIDKYVDQDDWRTVEWHNLNDFLKRFDEGEFKWRTTMSTSTLTTSFMSTTERPTITTLSTSSPVTNLWDIMRSLYPDITQDIYKKINAMDICPDKDFTSFKILIHKYLELYENLYNYASLNSLLSDEILFHPRTWISRKSKLEKIQVLSRNLLAYKGLFMTAIDHEVKKIFPTKSKQ